MQDASAIAVTFLVNLMSKILPLLWICIVRLWQYCLADDHIITDFYRFFHKIFFDFL